MKSINAKDSNLEKLGEEFSLRWMRSEVERHPQNDEALSELAHLLTRAGKFKEGLAVDLRVVSLKPTDPVARYNLACSYALLSQKQEALRELRKAVDLGYKDKEFLLKDRDLEQIRKDPEFQEIVQAMGKKV